MKKKLKKNGKQRIRLDWVQVRNMRLEYGTGEYTVQELADRYGITREYASLVIRGLRWRWLNNKYPPASIKQGRPYKKD